MKKTRLVLSVALAFAASAQVSATNGYFAHGYSAKDKGMAGAGVAKGGDTLTIANNPANLLDVGERMDIVFSAFNPNRSYSVTGGPFLPAGTTPVIG
ncbi:MAG: hypothetical protein V2I33_12770, partial [Kangiellaceae bacterium]|nr:hypothetical protein [Kangiellaceae bacterium]